MSPAVGQIATEGINKGHSGTEEVTVRAVMAKLSADDEAATTFPARFTRDKDCMLYLWTSFRAAYPMKYGDLDTCGGNRG